MLSRVIKRGIDVLLAGTALVLLSPVIALTAILVRVKLGSPVLFRQVRPGLHEAPFEMLKFRTMLDGDAPDEERLTAFGAKLRATSLDELPELVNIVRGEMSLVGPRPLLVRYLPLYSARQRRRHEVRPGLTGLAQVSGRNGLSWEERFEYDVQYVEERSLRLDARIIIKTVGEVLGARGVTSEDSVTMEPFTGSDEQER